MQLLLFSRTPFHISFSNIWKYINALFNQLQKRVGKDKLNYLLLLCCNELKLYIHVWNLPEEMNYGYIILKTSLDKLFRLEKSATGRLLVLPEEVCIRGLMDRQWNRYEVTFLISYLLIVDTRTVWGMLGACCLGGLGSVWNVEHSEN